LPPDFTEPEESGCGCRPVDSGVRITLLVDDADRVVERALAAGARVSMPAQDMFWGGR
jgi:PhnB protein